MFIIFPLAGRVSRSSVLGTLCFHFLFLIGFSVLLADFLKEFERCAGWDGADINSITAKLSASDSDQFGSHC